MHSHRTALIITGAMFEAFGLILLWTPDLAPDAAATWRRIRIGTAALVGWTARRVFRRPEAQVIEVGTARATAMAYPPTILMTAPAHLPLEEKVRILIDSDRRIQQRLGELEQRAETDAATIREDIAALRDDLHRHALAAAAAAVDEHRRRRSVGTGFVALGLVIGSLGNLA
jgi:hypothetical protein